MRITVSASVDADLSALVPSAGTLSPTFSRATTAYTLSVANSVTSMTLTPTAASAVAAITLAPGESYSGTYQASGAPDAFQYVTWKIDWGDAVAESNENNNTVAMPIR